MLRILPVLLVLALMIYALVDCLNTPEEEVRGLPKMVWIVIILVFGEIIVGPLAWLFLGRRAVPADGVQSGGQAGTPGSGAGTNWIAPDDNPEFLKSLKADKGPIDGPVDGPGKGPAEADEDPTQAGDATEATQDEAMLKEWEADLRRREEELRRRERGDGPGDS
ncbi:PLD nuclease N-terminal domain-containing protein [Streptomyces sp. YIM S03343]